MVAGDVTPLVNQPIIRIVACGSVDDGKSTLIGRLLAETDSVPDDLLDHARKIRRGGSAIPPGEIDFSLLTDGLEAERTQGITIDVAYRHLYLPSGKRAIIADAPGHEQYTRNMAVAASNADLAILLVDATKGIRPQTHRHLTVCALMGVHAVIVAVNKMDTVGYSQDTFDILSGSVHRAAAHLGFDDLTIIPVSALVGHNLVTVSQATTWYDGPTILDALSQWRPAASVGESVRMRLPVQYVLRTEECRVYTGTLVAGTLQVGDKIAVARSGVVAGVSRLLVAGRDAAEARPGSAVAVELDQDLDIARGDLLIEPPRSGEPALSITDFTADLVWTGDQALICGRSYLLVAGALTVPAVITTVCGRLELRTGKQLSADSLEINDIGVVEVVTDTAVPLEEYRRCRESGGFILVDRRTRDTVAAGMIRHGLRREHHVVFHAYGIDRAARARLKGQRPRVVWLTGLPGSGKSTIADALERRLHSRGLHTYVLDGDNVRRGLNKDLGFTPADRSENVRRIAETAKLILDAGLIVIVALVSPFRADRQAARTLFDDGDFVEVFVDTPIDVCIQRDPKMLYAKARAGAISNMTGVGQAYERPESPEVVLNGTAQLEVSITRLTEVIMRSAT